MITYITGRDGIPRRFALAATDRDAAHAEAQQIGRAFGVFTYCIRGAA